MGARALDGYSELPVMRRPNLSARVSPHPPTRETCPENAQVHHLTRKKIEDFFFFFFYFCFILDYCLLFFFTQYSQDSKNTHPVHFKFCLLIVLTLKAPQVFSHQGVTQSIEFPISPIMLFFDFWKGCYLYCYQYFNNISFINQ